MNCTSRQHNLSTARNRLTTMSGMGVSRRMLNKRQVLSIAHSFISSPRSFGKAMSIHLAIIASKNKLNYGAFLCACSRGHVNAS